MQTYVYVYIYDLMFRLNHQQNRSSFCCFVAEGQRTGIVSNISYFPNVIQNSFEFCSLFSKFLIRSFHFICIILDFSQRTNFQWKRNYLHFWHMSQLTFIWNRVARVWNTVPITVIYFSKLSSCKTTRRKKNFVSPCKFTKETVIHFHYVFVSLVDFFFSFLFTVQWHVAINLDKFIQIACYILVHLLLLLSFKRRQR